MNNWKNVKDELPDNDRNVLVFDEHGDYQLAYLENMHWHTNGSRWPLEGTQYWMELPTTPRERRNG